MDVFAFREELIAEYERFSRSFAKIRAEDISPRSRCRLRCGTLLARPSHPAQFELRTRLLLSVVI